MVESGGHGAVVGERHHEPELFHHGVFGLGVRVEFDADGADYDFWDVGWECGDCECVSGGVGSKFVGRGSVLMCTVRVGARRWVRGRGFDRSLSRAIVSDGGLRRSLPS